MREWRGERVKSTNCSKRCSFFPSKLPLVKLLSSPIKSVIPYPSNSDFQAYNHPIQASFVAVAISVVSFFLTSGAIINKCLLDVIFSVPDASNDQISCSKISISPPLNGICKNPSPLVFLLLVFTCQLITVWNSTCLQFVCVLVISELCSQVLTVYKNLLAQLYVCMLAMLDVCIVISLLCLPWLAEIWALYVFFDPTFFSHINAFRVDVNRQFSKILKKKQYSLRSNFLVL